jgi:hypothetical protein
MGEEKFKVRTFQLLVSEKKYDKPDGPGGRLIEIRFLPEIPQLEVLPQLLPFES